MALCPQLYEQERARVAARFEEAVRLAEQAFLDEFARLVAHLTERITGADDDGTAKVFRDSAVDNLVGVLRAVPRAERPLERAARRPGRPRRSGRSAGSRRRTSATATGCASGSRRSSRGSQSSLDALLVDRPRRRILRRRRAAGGADGARRRPRRRGRGGLRRGDRPGRARPPRDRPRQPRRARPRRPLDRRPGARRRAGARPLRLAAARPLGGRARLAARRTGSARPG